MYGLFLYFNVTLKNLFLFTKLKKMRWLSHIKIWHLNIWKKHSLMVTPWLTEVTGNNTYLACWCGNPLVKKLSSRPLPQPSTCQDWQRTGLEKQTEWYDYVQCFGIAESIPFDVFYIWQTFTFASKEPSHMQDTHVKEKKNHTSFTHMHFFNNKGYNHHPHNTSSAHFLEYLI